jgi:hypothetical protein
MKGLGFEPVLNAKGRLEKMIIRAWQMCRVTDLTLLTDETESTSGEIYVVRQERGESDAEFSERLWNLSSK